MAILFAINIRLLMDNQTSTFLAFSKGGRRLTTTVSGTQRPVSLHSGRGNAASLLPRFVAGQRPAGKPGRWARARRSPQERSRRAPLLRGGGAPPTASARGFLSDSKTCPIYSSLCRTKYGGHSMTNCVKWIGHDASLSSPAICHLQRKSLAINIFRILRTAKYLP